MVSSTWCSSASRAGLRLVFGRLDRGGGLRGEGRGAKKICVPKMGFSFLALFSNFQFFPQENFFGFGWVGALAWGGGSARSAPPPPFGISTYLVRVVI